MPSFRHSETFLPFAHWNKSAALLLKSVPLCGLKKCKKNILLGGSERWWCKRPAYWKENLLRIALSVWKSSTWASCSLFAFWLSFYKAAQYGLEIGQKALQPMQFCIWNHHQHVCTFVLFLTWRQRRDQALRLRKQKILNLIPSMSQHQQRPMLVSLF